MLKSAIHEPNGQAALTVSPTSSRSAIQKTYAEAVSSTLPKSRTPAPASRPVASAAKTLPQKSIKDEAIGPRHDGPDRKVVRKPLRTSPPSDSSPRGVP